jgi:HrpA-like RNA helicase
MNNKSNNQTNNIIKKYIKLPKDKYVFYDEYLPADLKLAFKKPIGLYDPFGENINPLTGEHYQNVWADKDVSFNSGNAMGKKVPTTYLNWSYIWTNLPLFSMVGDIIKSIRENNITVIRAGTGVGKSFLAGRVCAQAFNFQKKIIMTLPKKIIARDTALTTSKTCDVRIGEEVGYYFKGDKEMDKNGKETKIIFTTTGSLIRTLTGDDPYLEKYDCVIIDEAHERTVQTDEIILFLKKALEKRTDLKVVFISATLNIEEFRNYYKGYSFNVVDMGEGTSFEIKDYYEKEKPLDWQKLASEKIMDILKSGKEGDILVFIKSKSDGNKMRSIIEPLIKKLNNKENPFITVLAAGITQDEQEYAISEFAYKNHPDSDMSNPYTRKIVFATNVAESSLTVKGASFVIDCGLALEDFYEPLKNTSALLEKFVSKSAIKQRRGRVGRTKPGECYHLYSEKELAGFTDYPIPSIQKSDLTMDILDIMKMEKIIKTNNSKSLQTNNSISIKTTKTMKTTKSKKANNLESVQEGGINKNEASKNVAPTNVANKKSIPYVKNFGEAKQLLNDMISPPEKKFVDSAQLNLYSMGAITTLDDTATLTEFGRGIAKFSGLPIHLARAVIASYYYSSRGANHRVYYKDYIIPIVVIVGLLQGRIENLYGDFRPRSKLSNADYKRELAIHQKKQHQFDSKYGDFLTIHNVYQEFRKFMKLPKSISPNIEKSQNIAQGGGKNNNNNSNNNIANSPSIQVSQLTHKTMQDARDWCNQNGIDARVFVNMRDKKNWDKVGSESFKIARKLMDIVQPADLRLKKFKEYKEHGGNSTKIRLKNEIVTNRVENRTVDPEDIISIDAMEEDESDIVIPAQGGAIQFGGYNRSAFELNFFPDIKVFPKEDENILMILGHGLFINIAKHINGMKYKTCYPFEKTYCVPDRYTTVSLAQKPAFLIYYELFMMREGQKELKLNFISRLPTGVTDEIKRLYKQHIEDCYKKDTHNKNAHTHEYSGKKGHKGQKHDGKRKQDKGQKGQKRKFDRK